MSQLALSNVITISVSAAPAGVGAYNTSNLALFTRDTYGAGFGTAGYKIYKTATEVGTDFGTASDTFKMATAIFSQKPNILAGGGYLVVIPLHHAAAVTFATTDVNTSTEVLTVTAHGLETGERAQVSSSGTLPAGLSAATDYYAIKLTANTLKLATSQALALAGTAINLTDVGSGTHTLTPSAEKIDEAISRTANLVQYFGVLVAEITTGANQLLAAAIIQTMNKIAFWPQFDAASAEVAGDGDDFRAASLHQNRALLYVGTGVALDALKFAAAYASRALSTDFSGSNTTQTMHLKDLVGIEPDSGMTQTILQKCITAGIDVYASFQGVAKTFCSGANNFFDQVYNQQWLVGALEVAGFNALAQSSSKLPQTEQGIGVLKAAYRTVLEQAVKNQYFAPGVWNSADTFGNLDDFHRNIGERGYYIYSSPVASQLAADRTARVAPLIQIAGKEAGAVHSTSVIVYINA